MSLEKTSLLESVLGRSHPAHRDNLSFVCPFCKHPKPKLNVSLGTGKWGCWVCGESHGTHGHTVPALFVKMRLGKDKIERAKQLWGVVERFEVNKKEILILPDEYIPLHQPDDSIQCKIALNYLRSRNVTDQQIIKYGIGYAKSGEYRQRIILPSYDAAGQLNFFSARSYLPDPIMKFKVPPDLDKHAFITYEDQINWDEPIIIVESQFDAIAIRRNAIPLNGKSIGNLLKQRILEYKPPKIILCLDGDAVDAVMRHASYLTKMGLPTFRVSLPVAGDPSSLGYDEIWRLINSSHQITESKSFEYQILSKLS